MFTAERRDHVRDRVVELARTDSRVTAGALTGSTAVGAEDDWSDIDVAFGITDGVTPDAVLRDWTEILYREFSILDHFDLRSGSSVYRVFLLPDGLEVDVGVTPGHEFGARPALPRPLRCHPPSGGHAAAGRRIPHRAWLAPRPPRPVVHRARQAVAGRILDQWDPRSRARPCVPPLGRGRRLRARRRSPPRRRDWPARGCARPLAR